MKKIRKYILIFGVILVSLLMISNVTAVPYTKQEPITSRINKMKEKLKKISERPLFEKLETLSKENFNQKRLEIGIDKVKNLFEELSNEKYYPEQKESTINMHKVILKMKNLDIGTMDFILKDLVDLILLIFGHNIIGKTIAFLVSSIILIPISFGLGIVELCVFFIAMIILLILYYIKYNEEINKNLEGFLRFFGLIFGVIILSMGVIIVLFSIPFLYLEMVIENYIDEIKALIEYLSSTSSIYREKISELKCLAQEILDDFRNTSIPLGIQ